MAYAVRVWLKKLYFGSKVPEIPFLGVPAPVFATNRPSEWGDFQLDVPESIKEYRTQNSLLQFNSTEKMDDKNLSSRGKSQ